MLERLRAAYRTARDHLLAERAATGHWVGELSASALSTATAISALSLASRAQHAGLIDRGVEWLDRHQNADGGWGDTDRSISNIAATMLVRAAFHLAGHAATARDALGRAEAYVRSQGGVEGLRQRYGADKTFAVPILTNCALAGLERWADVAPLPFELACLPYPLLRFLRLPVVSYAVPALVAIGQARYFHAPPRNPLVRLVRRSTVAGSLKTLERMQPSSGGFLEATPLTSFVVMSLAGTGRAAHPVVARGVEFLRAAVRPDGSWPIDTNLATWNTTLAVNALAGAGEDMESLSALEWLLACQHRQLHPFTHAAPGGWGWTDLSGAVPDADDTSGALLALATLVRSAAVADKRPLESAAQAGIGWLLDLQNRDGGWPTFCRGWGALPFDRSGVDLTAHAIRALHAWRTGAAESGLTVPCARIDAAVARGLSYLARQQRPEGSWIPLWFGNQAQAGEENPVYGTARVLLAYRDLGLMETDPAQRGLAWLAANRSADGGWGGSPGEGKGPGTGAPSSVEETAVAVEALLAGGPDHVLQRALDAGLGWLIEAVAAGRHRQSAPIGFYFARLWYYERMYPLVFLVSALGRAQARV